MGCTTACLREVMGSLDGVGGAGVVEWLRDVFDEDEAAQAMRSVVDGRSKERERKPDKNESGSKIKEE